MKRKMTPFAKKVRQFKYLSKKVQRQIDSGTFSQLSEQQQKTLFAKVRQRFLDLRSVFPKFQLKKLVAGCGLLLSLSFGQQVQAQSFSPPVINPFGINLPEKAPLTSAADIDNDGDLDLLISGYDDDAGIHDITFLENIGTALAPAFAAPISNPFGLQAVVNNTNNAIVDIDNDGDLDMFQGEYFENGTLWFLENIGTAELPNFATPIANPFGVTNINQNNIPIFADLDNDGDQDLFQTANYGNFRYYENTGTATLANFAAPVTNPFGLSSNNAVTFPQLGDLDMDGDLDMLNFTVGDYGGVLSYLENTGTAESPSFATAIETPFGLTTTAYFLVPALADMDGDSDLDLWTGLEEYGDINYYENISINIDSPPTVENNTIDILENLTYTFNEADFPVVDAASDALNSIQITSLPSLGALELNGSAVVLDQIIPTIDISDLIYTPLTNEFGMGYASFEFKANTGEDDPLWSENSATIIINVLEVNTIPTSEDNIVTTDEDVPYVFSNADFAFNDDDGDLVAIVVSELETVGNLQFNGADVIVDQSIPVADLGQLTFTPNVGEFGDNYDSFRFRVNDGTDNSELDYNMQINVIDVVGTNNIDLNASVQLFPNPASDFIQLDIQWENAPATIQVNLLDAQGRTLKVLSDTNGVLHFTERFDISELAAGTYFLQIHNGIDTGLQQFVKR